MKKKFLRNFLVIFAFVIVMIPIYMAFAETKIKFTLTADADTKVRGDEVRLELSISDASEGWSGLGLKVNYDTEDFEYKDFEISESLPRKVSIVSNEVTDGVNIAGFYAPSNASDNYTEYNGPIGTLILKVKDTASADYDFDINLTELLRSNSAAEGDTTDLLPNAIVENETITVNVPVDSISVESENVPLLKGTWYNINVIPNPTDTTVLKNASYEVSENTPLKPGENVVEVSPEGVVRATANGEAKVKVTAYGLEKTITFTVTNPITDIKLNESHITLTIGDIEGAVKEQTLEATIVPDDPTGDTTLTWKSSQEDVASVTQDGKVTALKGGQTIITVESKNGVKAECVVDVVVPLTSATLSEPGPFKLNRGDTKDLTINWEPKETTDDTTITWESDNTSVATVTNDGHITAVGGGEAHLTGHLGTYKTFKVTVNVYVALESLDIVEENVTLLPNQTQDLTLKINPVDTSEKDTITWEVSQADNFIKFENGKITALKPGTATVTVKGGADGDITDTVNVKVLIPIDSVTIKPSSVVNLNKGEKTNFSVEITPAEAEEDKTVTWSSSEPSIVSIDATTGEATAKKGGDAVITGQLKNGKSVTATVHVKVPVDSITIEQGATLEIERGKQTKLTTIIKPDDYYVSDKVVWATTENSTVSVDQNGVITANAIGSATISATIDGKVANIIVTVIVPIKNVTINEEPTKDVINVNKNETYQLTASVDPTDTTESYTFKWISSDDNIASVDEDGLVTAKKGGDVTITVEANGHQATKKIHVVVPITSFTVSDEEMTILKGAKNAQTIITVIAPADANENKTITWESDNEEVAIVDENGKVTGLKAGNATITGTLPNGMSVSVDVTVEIIPLDDFTVTMPDKLLKGKSADIVLTADPIDSTEMENIVFTSSDEDVLKVDENGHIIAIKAGSATVTIKIGDITKTVKITVEEIPATSIKGFIKEGALNIGDKSKVYVEVNPQDTTDELTFTYTSSDENIVKVDNEGNIVAVGSGKAIITITASNGLTSTLEIVVNAKEASPKTGMNSYVGYLITAISSLSLVGVVGYKRYQISKVK